jgi:integrase
MCPQITIRVPKLHLTDSFIRGCESDSGRTEYHDEKYPGLTLRVTDKGSKTFVYRYRIHKKSKRYTIGKYPAIPLKKAREEHTRLYVLVSQEIDPQKEKMNERHREVKSIYDLAEKYKAVHFKKLKASTSEDYRRRIDNVILPNIGHIEAAELTRANIIEFLEEIAESAPIQSNRVRAILSSMYSFGVNRAMFDFNPVSTVKPLAEENTRDRVFSVKEVKKIWDVFTAISEPYGSLFKMLLVLGQRSGETRKMKWADLDENIWTIPKEDTKANRRHHVPLPNLALEILTHRKSLSTGPFVFESPLDNQSPIQWLQNKAGDSFKAAKVEDARLHDLRRTAASFMAELGTSRIVVGKVLNHKGLAGDSTVTAIYDRHDYMTEKREALDTWNHKLYKLISS